MVKGLLIFFSKKKKGVFGKFNALKCFYLNKKEININRQPYHVKEKQDYHDISAKLCN